MLRNFHVLGIVLIVATLAFSQTIFAVIIVHNDSSSTIKARCIGKGKTRRWWTILPGGRAMIGCQPSYVSQGIEVEIQKNHETIEILRKRWRATGMIEPDGKHIDVHLKERFDTDTGFSTYSIVVKK